MLCLTVPQDTDKALMMSPSPLPGLAMGSPCCFLPCPSLLNPVQIRVCRWCGSADAPWGPALVVDLTSLWDCCFLQQTT